MDGRRELSVDERALSSGMPRSMLRLSSSCSLSATLSVDGSPPSAEGSGEGKEGRYAAGEDVGAGGCAPPSSSSVGENPDASRGESWKSLTNSRPRSPMLCFLEGTVVVDDGDCCSWPPMK